jgi:hypothetical protein
VHFPKQPIRLKVGPDKIYGVLILINLVCGSQKIPIAQCAGWRCARVGAGKAASLALAVGVQVGDGNRSPWNRRTHRMAARLGMILRDRLVGTGLPRRTKSVNTQHWHGG